MNRCRCLAGNRKLGLVKGRTYQVVNTVVNTDKSVDITLNIDGKNKRLYVRHVNRLNDVEGFNCNTGDPTVKARMISA